MCLKLSLHLNIIWLNSKLFRESDESGSSHIIRIDEQHNQHKVVVWSAPDGAGHAVTMVYPRSDTPAT